MKKSILIAFLSITCLVAKSQNKDTVGLNLPIKDGKIIYESVIEVPGKSKDDLYKNAQQWFVDAFNSSKDVIQNPDKEEGKIIGKGVSTAYYSNFATSTTYNNMFTIKIEVKDGKYRYRMYDMILTSPSKYNSMIGVIPSMSFTPEDILGGLLGPGKRIYTKKGSKQILSTMDAKIQIIIASLKSGMNITPSDF